MRAQEEMTEEMRRQQELSQQQMQPFLNTGTMANAELGSRLAGGFDPANIASSPAYQFREQEGQRALQNQLLASGMSQSGEAMRRAQEFGQGLASTEVDAEFGRFATLNNQLANQANMGLSAAGGISNLNTNIGNINAANTAGQTNQITQGIGTLLANQIVGYDAMGRPIYRQ
jgi:hypothetical protein